MNEIVKEISQGRPYDVMKVEGYTEKECCQISRLYDIDVKNTEELYDFLLQMGRCDGGLIGDDPIILYRGHWSVRTQIFFQNGLYECLKENKIYGFLKNKPFTFSLESETQYYFMLTAKDAPKTVQHYDDNRGIVEDTNMTFIDYMRSVVSRYHGKGTGVICKGELINI